MAWRVATSLVKLREQVNRLYPERSKASDGTIGDAAHQTQVSDHNPNSAGVVTVFDITHDPAHGLDIAQLAAALADSRDTRIKYLIRNREILIPASGWSWQPYVGVDPHENHLHVSVAGIPAFYDDGTDWNINQEQEDDMATTLNRALITSMAKELLNRNPTSEELDMQEGKPMLDLYRAWTSDDNPERANIQRLTDLGIQANKAGWKPGAGSDGVVELKPGVYKVN